MENINMTMTLALTVVSGIALEAMLGFFQFKNRGFSVRRRYNDRLFKIVAFLITVALTVEFVACGGAAVAVERMVVILKGDSSPLLAPVAVSLLLTLGVVISFGLFQVIGYNIGQWQRRRIRLWCKSR